MRYSCHFSIMPNFEKKVIASFFSRHSTTSWFDGYWRLRNMTNTRRVIVSHDTVHLSSFPSSSSSMSTADVSNWPPVSMLFTTALAKYPAVIEYLDEMKASKLSLRVIWLSCGKKTRINYISVVVKYSSWGVESLNFIN